MVYLIALTKDTFSKRWIVVSSTLSSSPFVPHDRNESSASITLSLKKHIQNGKSISPPKNVAENGLKPMDDNNSFSGPALTVFKVVLESTKVVSPA